MIAIRRVAVRSRTGEVALPTPALVLAAGVALLFFGYAWARWATLQSSALDLAYFDQVVWNASQGRGFTSSFAPYPFLGQHFSPALALLVPLYWIHPSPLWLQGAQSLALSAAVVPLYVLARTWLSHRAALVACAAYAAQVFVLHALAYDFHTESLAVPFVFVAILGAVRRSGAGDRVLLLSGIAPMLCKEDGALVSLGIGFLAWAVLRRRAGLVLMVTSLAYGLVVTAVIMPAIRGGQPGDLIARYAYLGSSVPGVLVGLITHPQVAVLHLLSPDPLIAVAVMLGGVAFLPLARPLAALSGMPALLIELLSQHVQQSTLLDQYGLQPGPLIFVAALLGWVRISQGGLKIPWLTSEGRLRAVLLAGTLVALVVAAPVPTLGSWDEGQAAKQLVSAVPPDASVAASSDLAPMLAERRSIGVLPAPGREWIAADASVERSEVVARLPDLGYVLVERWGSLSLWRRQT